jgi:peptidoglycan/LPS O-acetylase OafA/YrhL
MKSLLGIESSDIRYVLLLLAFSTAMALVSYYVIELPALRWRRAVPYRTISPGEIKVAALNLL